MRIMIASSLGDVTFTRFPRDRPRAARVREVTHAHSPLCPGFPIAVREESSSAGMSRSADFVAQREHCLTLRGNRTMWVVSRARPISARKR